MRPHLNLDEIYNDTNAIPVNKKEAERNAERNAERLAEKNVERHTGRNAERNGDVPINGVPTRTQFLKGYGYDDNDLGMTTGMKASVRAKIRQNIRSRLRFFCHHVRWICRNIVNLEAIESRKDLVTFSQKNVRNLRNYSSTMLKMADKDVSHGQSSLLNKSPMPDVLKLLHGLESVMAREYITPVLSVNYLKHIQGMGAALMKPHWALDSSDLHPEEAHKYRVQELSQHVIPIYFNLMTLLHLLDFDLHNSLFYQCTTLLQKYHYIASGRGGFDEKEKSFYDQHVTFLNDVATLFEVVHEMVHGSSSSSSTLMVPSSVATLWAHELQLVLDMFELYKSDL